MTNKSLCLFFNFYTWRLLHIEDNWNHISPPAILFAINLRGNRQNLANLLLISNINFTFLFGINPVTNKSRQNV